MATKKQPEPKIIDPSDIDPRYDWTRPIMALGPMAVDFEERVDFRRLHRYRLGRTRAGADEIGARRAPVLRPVQYPLHHLDGDRQLGARQIHRATRCSPATASRISGISARPPSIIGCSRPGCRSIIATPGCSACAARFIPRSG